MGLQDFRRRIQAERSVRAQRDAAERRIPGERLRREIREAFARERARKPAEDRAAGAERGPLDGKDAERG
jgi:hypothetical protein